MAKIYVGSSLFNSDRVRQLYQKLIGLGHEITYDWTQHGQVFDLEKLFKIGILEENGVFDADIFLMVLPARSGTHWEGGFARGLQIMGKKIEIIILMEHEHEQERKTFHYLPGIHRFTDEDSVINFIQDYAIGEQNVQ